MNRNKQDCAQQYDNNLDRYKVKRNLTVIVGCVLLSALASHSFANERDEAKRIYDRLVGSPPSVDMLNTLESLVNGGQYRDAAILATQEDGFYNVTIKNMVTPWTNEDGDAFAPLNDYTATVIGMVRDEVDFRQVLSGDILYVGDTNAVPSPSPSNNNHYAELEAQNISLRDTLIQTAQSTTYGIPSDATAGIMTSRAAAKAFFVAGTNRAMFRFTLMNHLCRDLEQVKDITRPSDRIRQDVSRSPGGDSRIFLNSCIGCHSGMDPMAQAFAYYDWSGAEGADDGALIYDASAVQEKYLINSNNFPHGFITPDDSWDNYWRSGPNANLGWGAGSGSGNGAKTMGQELANSDVFATCQAQKVFKAVCLRAPHSGADISQISAMTNTFKGNGYHMRDLFVDAAVYCRAE
ncbi:MAG: hypothetical protein P1U67_13695 [Alcanivoracaceae bacterium]|nr:hypothetical protein [Alcanivoracaceae bacterium]